MERLKISENRRFLIKESGEPFFWLGDTAWELLHSLSREEMVMYLECRARQGFTVVQTVALAEMDGLRVPNFYGRYPLVKKNGNFLDVEPDDTGEYSYWNHVDYFIEQAQKRGLYVALLPTWGDKYNLKFGIGPEIFDADKAEIYGRWIGARYREANNVIWVLGGDRSLETETHFAVNNALARGIRESGAKQMISMHPDGENSSSKFYPNADWLDFHMIQSGHQKRNYENYVLVYHDYRLPAVKPVLDAEPRYEDHPVGFQPQYGYFDDHDVRQAAYWAVFAGGCGVTYGHHCVWRMNREPGDYFVITWQAALSRPAAEQMHHLKDMLLADQLLTMHPAQEHLQMQYEGANYIAVLESNHKIYCYSPNGLKIVLQETVSFDRAEWMNPRTGGHCAAEAKKQTFQPPTSGRNEDWVLILEK